MALRNKASEEVNHEVDGTPLPRVCDLRNVFELVEHAFDDGAFPEEQLVSQGQEPLHHVALPMGQEANA